MRRASADRAGCASCRRGSRPRRPVRRPCRRSGCPRSPNRSSSDSSTSTGMFARRSCSTASPWVRPVPPEITRSATEGDDLLDVDRRVVATSGTDCRLRRVVRRVLRSCRRRATPAPIANSVSVAEGVSETILCGARLIVTGVPSSSVSVIGKGRGRGGRHAAREDRRRGGADRRCGRRRTRRTAHGEYRDRDGKEAHGTRKRSRDSHAVPTLSLEGRARHCGSATGLPSRAMVTVAGLCRTLTGFAAAQCVVW